MQERQVRHCIREEPLDANEFIEALIARTRRRVFANLSD